MPPTRAIDMNEVSTAAGSSRGAICVVDDDPWALDSLAVLLQAHEFDVLTYTSGAEFLADQRRQGVARLIVDHHMPGMDGLDMLDVLRKEGVAVPAILVTGRLDANIAARAVRLGVTQILEKPFSTPRLLRLIGAGGGAP